MLCSSLCTPTMRATRKKRLLCWIRERSGRAGFNGRRCTQRGTCSIKTPNPGFHLPVSVSYTGGVNMHRNVPAWIGAAVVIAAGAVCTLAGCAQSAGAATDQVITGEIQIQEISGVAFLPGDRLLVVADDPHP